MGLFSFIKALFLRPDPAERQKRQAVEEEIAAALAAEAKRQREEEERCQRQQSGKRDEDEYQFSFRRNDGPRFSVASKTAPEPWLALMQGIMTQPSFSEVLLRLVHLRFNDNAPAVYRAAKLSRQAYSAIISDKDHQVTRNTALALAFALKLTEEEADKFLALAGYAMSPAKKPDLICRACLRHGLHDIDTLNQILAQYDCPPLS